VSPRLCKEWSSPAELRSHVVASIVNLMKQYPAVGWVRGDAIDDAAAVTLNRLRTEKEELEKQLEHYANKGHLCEKLSQRPRCILCPIPIRGQLRQ